MLSGCLTSCVKRGLVLQNSLIYNIIRKKKKEDTVSLRS